MNLDQELRLEKVFVDNQNKGIAIAITGSWGIGKTFFWQKFLKDQTLREYDHFDSFYYYASKVNYIHIFENKKYVYISLFGVESLDALKNEIAIKLGWNPHSQNVHKHYGIPQLLKNTLAQFKDVKFSQYGISSSSKLVDSLLFRQVKNAIICFDDFERLSEKLKIQDVMGLANQLKLERNCQVVLVLDESRTDSENKNKYAEYREKLIDETIKITSVESLLREKAKQAEIEKPLVDLMVRFANELEIHNFRFFQKVIRLYKKFRVKLSDDVAYLTKEIILIRVLQGYFIEDFGEDREFSWGDIQLVLENGQKDWSPNKIKTYESLKEINYYFVYKDLWLNEFKKEFDQKGEPDFSKLHELANSELISEKSNQIRDDLDVLMGEWRNLKIDQTFCKRLYETATNSIGYESLENLSFYSDLLREFNEPDLAENLNSNVERWLDNQYLIKGIYFVSDQFDFGFNPNNKFHSYLKELRDLRPNQGLPDLIDVVYRYVEHNGHNSNTDPKVLELATKQDWQNLIFEAIESDERFQAMNKFKLLQIILKQQISIELQPKINAVIFDLLADEAQKSNSERKRNIDYVIKRLKE